jgi:kumamolisin
MVSGDVRIADRLFHAAVERYQLANGTIFIAGRHDPIVPAFMRPLVEDVVRPSTEPALRAAVPGAGLSPAGIARAYDIEPLVRQGMDGTGQSVVFIEVDGVDQSALSAFASRFHLPPFHYRTLGPALTPGPEATMDLEVVHAIAPKARLIVYNFRQSVISASGIQLLSSLISANPGSIISESIAFCERYSTAAGARAFESAYALADLAGEAAFVSTGDSGAFGCISPSDTSPTQAAISAMLPAASPGVTAVGGTRLSVRADGSWYNETVWEDPVETEGTGGGASGYFARPSWQRAPGLVAQANLYGVPNRRLLPDVSADADPASGMTIAFPGSGGSPSWGRGGGTSQAAPIWAAIAALIDQYLVQNHHQKIGWMNPALYSLAQTPQPYPPFHDVSVGSNLAFAAGKGYDMATGLGTPDAWNLARDLANYQSSRGR